MKLGAVQKLIQSLLARIDRWQRANRFIAPTYGVIKKFGDDGLNQFVVGLGWYGFVAVYPLLLVVITIFGFIGAASLGHGIVSTLHQFPVVGSDFNPAHESASLHGSVLGLVVGLVGLIYGAQGVTQTAQQAMARVWNVSQPDVPGFFPRLARSLIGLVIIGGAFVVNAAIATFATGAGESYAVRIPALCGMLLINVVLYFAAFRALTPRGVGTRSLLPGAIVGSFGFTLLITLGSGLIQHELRNSSATYGQFGIVIGLVGFLLLLAKVSLYGAELNPVLARHLWPRGILSSDPSAADNQVLHDTTHQERGRR
jgi:membrane protein